MQRALAGEQEITLPKPGDPARTRQGRGIRHEAAGVGNESAFINIGKGDFSIDVGKFSVPGLGEHLPPYQRRTPAEGFLP